MSDTQIADKRGAISSLPLALIDHLPDAVIIVDGHGRITRANPRVATLFGYEPRALLGWIESGGPPVAPPASRGFGTVLVEHGLTHIGAGVKLGFPATGVICEIVLPITERSRPASDGRQDD